MSKPEVDEKTKARWRFGELWNKLHFGHLSKGNKWKGMEAAYRFGLNPFKKFVQNGLNARRKRKELMTFQIEPITLWTKDQSGPNWLASLCSCDWNRWGDRTSHQRLACRC